ncbi:MAG: SusC/RagA family TonB-linked outer membrane protein, partial [Ferruginibacter sp.]
MKKTALLLCAFIVLCISQVFAQNLQITGRVTSKTNEPLVGATVAVKGGSAVTLTDANGNYSIAVPKKGSTIVVSFTGMSPQERVVNTAGSVNFNLSTTNTALEEVVVIGYGTQKKSVVTGAISSVKASDLDNQPINRVDQFLQGRASGLTVAASSGQPGSALTVRVRGTTTLNGGNDPLYVVDGVPVDVGGIDYLNPSDIESIEVLKDAASAAIYGTRSAAGVILVTTKKGRAGKTVMSYNGYYGTQAPANKLNLLDAKDYATLRNEASVAGGGSIVFANPASLGKGTDWQSLIFNNSAKIQDHEISISGGNEKSTFYTSFGLFDQEGIVGTQISEYKRFNFRMNGTHKINNWLSVGTNLGYSHIKGVGIGGLNTEYGGILSSAVNLDPITGAVITDPALLNSAPYLPDVNNRNGLGTVRDANGYPYGISNIVTREMSNPLAYIKTHLGNFGWSDNLVGNAYAEIEPIKGLKIRTNVGAKYAFYGSESFNPYYFYNTDNKNIDHNSLYSESDRALNYTWENTASYTHAFGEHHVTALVGTGAYVNNYQSRGQGTTYYDLPVNTFDDAQSGRFTLPDSVKKGFTYQNYPDKLSSVYGRVVYDYAEKYLLSGILRRDGSSHFGSNNKYGYFPGASVGWVASKENFWPENKVVDFLKIRGSYGTTGNDNIANFAYVSSVANGRNYTFGGNDNYTFGNSPAAIANPDLRWEQTSQTDIGFDANLHQNFTLA